MSDRLRGLAEPTEGVGGHRVVLAVYASVLGVAALLGGLIGLIRPVALDPTLFFLIDLPPTALGMAVFGMVTVGTGLGLLLLGVRFVSRYDSEKVA